MKCRNGTAAPTRLKHRALTAPTWEGDEYLRVEQGRRMVCGVKIQGPEWVHAFSRWSLRIEFQFMDEPGTVSLFINLGANRERPTIGGRRSNYYKYWTLAKGGPPRKHEVMNYDIFVGKCFWALVEDCVNDSTGKAKHADEIYSKIVDLVELIKP